MVVADEKIRKHDKEKMILLQKLPVFFSDMKHYLNCGQNILLYGVGSKRKFLNLFAMKIKFDEPTLVINGYHSGAAPKTLTNSILRFA